MQTAVLDAEKLVNLEAWLSLGDGETVMLGVLYRAWGGVPSVGARLEVKDHDESYSATESLVRLFKAAERLAERHGVDLRSDTPCKKQVGVWMLAQKEQMN